MPNLAQLIAGARRRPVSAVFLAALLLLIGVAVRAQQRMGTIEIIKSQGIPVVAVPDLKGAGAAQGVMVVFNKTLTDDLQGSGVLKIAPKSMYPLRIPQQPADFRPPIQPPAPRRGVAPPPVQQGPWLTDWANPPVSADYLAFGYTAEQEGRLVLLGWFYNVKQADVSNAQVFGKRYYSSLDEAGARDVAHQFAADILAQFGAKTLAGTKIWYISNRTGNKEIWSMDYDGSNQKQFTSYRSISITPAVSMDGSRIAFTSYTKGSPVILIHSTQTGRRLPFYNQETSLNTTPEFTPDGSKVLFASTAGGNGFSNLFIANGDGSGLRRLTSVRALEVEPRVNPKTGNEVVFTSGRSGVQAQIYMMNIDGADVTRVTPGEGEAVNASWSPDGKYIAFSWTRGYEPGHYNVFVMDIATRQFVQLTHGEGKNENPTWAPDGAHIAFSSDRAGTPQIYTMLADGTQVKQLTTQGRNEKPVWR